MLARLAPAAALVLLMAAPAHAKGPANASFKGHWVPDSGVGWKITKENRKTGKCSGTSDIAGYTLTACHVTGHKYKFQVRTGGYVSFNTGSFHGKSLTGEFHDSNGTKVPYTATLQ